MARVETDGDGVRVYREKPAGRPGSLPVLRQLPADHYVGEATILAADEFNKAAEIIRNSLPVSKRVRSGDLAELLGTEYLNAETNYRAPIRKLL